MLPSMDLLETNLRDLGPADLILKVGTIVDLGKAHSGLQNVPEDVPGPPILEKLNIDYAASVHAALDGGKRDSENRDAIRLTLLESVMMWGQHIIMRYKRIKDPNILQNNGFDLKKAVVKNSKNKGPTPVPEVRLRHGESEEIVAIVKQIPGRGTYEVRYTTNPGDPGAWMDGGHHTYCQISQKGCIPGTKYYFSVRYHGPNGTSAWSEPISIIAL